MPLLPEWRPTLVPAQGDGDLTWAYPWPGGERLAADLAAVVDCRGLAVAELGCGRGRCGLTALLLGARSAAFCDGADEPLAYVRQALVLNGLEAKGTTHVQAWGGAVPGAPYDLLIGADVLYRPAFHRALLTSLALGLAPHGTALLSDPRGMLEAELPGLAAELGLTWREEARPGPYTLVRLTHARTPALESA